MTHEAFIDEATKWYAKYGAKKMEALGYDEDDYLRHVDDSYFQCLFRLLDNAGIEIVDDRNVINDYYYTVVDPDKIADFGKDFAFMYEDVGSGDGLLYADIRNLDHDLVEILQDAALNGDPRIYNIYKCAKGLPIHWYDNIALVENK